MMLGRFGSIVTPSTTPVTPPPDDVPPGYHVIDPDIDATGATDVTVDLNAWHQDLYNRFGEGSSSRVLKVWAPAGARYQHNDGFALAQQYELWATSPNNPAEFRNPLVFPFRGQPVAATNPQGFVAPSWYEITGNVKQFGWAISAANTGPGGVSVVTRLDPDNYTDIYGVHRSGLFDPAVVGKACDLYYFDPSDTKDPGPDGRGALGKWKQDPHGQFSITAISANRKQLTLNAAAHSSPINATFPEGDRFFAIVPRGDWENVFMPNPGWNRLTFTGPSKNGTAADRAAAGNARHHPDSFLRVAGHHNRVLDINLRGPNPGWLNANYNSGYTDPIEYENHALVSLEGSHCAVGSSRPVALSPLQRPIMHVHHGFAHGVRPNFSTNTWVHDAAFHHVGRQAISFSYGYGAVLERLVLYATAGAVIDNEPTYDVANPTLRQFTADNPYGPSQAQYTCDWVHYRDLIFGEDPSRQNNSDIAGSNPTSPVGHILFQGLSSLDAHVAAGIIPAKADFRTPKYGMSRLRTPPAGNVIVRDTDADLAVEEWVFAYGANYLFERNERRVARSNSGAVKYIGCLNYMSRQNTVNGVLDPRQYEATTAPSSFVGPGTLGATGDWWWDRNAPDPPNYWRDL